MVKIVWSINATKQLKKIFLYYKDKVSETIAKKIINGIVRKVSILNNNPLIGSKEEMLNHLKHDFRYLLEGNYKIIYFLRNDIITIASAFDCRQNPNKITKI